MKLSLKLQDDQLQNPLLKAKIPISIFNQPFVSSLTTFTTTTATSTSSSCSSKAKTSTSDLSFSLSTNFPSGPSLKFSYAPTTTPFSVSLKSGLGLFGSPRNSPLVFSANFSLSPTNPTVVVPSFSLHFKPQLGHFSLHKTTFSTPNPLPDSGSDPLSRVELQSRSPSNSEFANGFAPDEPSGWQELKLEPYTSSNNGSADPNPSISGVHPNGGFGSVSERQLVWGNSNKGGFSSGFFVMARTVFPVTKRVIVNLRWGVNGPVDSLSKMPYLKLNKIGIERVEEVKEVEKKEKGYQGDVGNIELLKGMCFWMRRDLEVLEKENREMKQCLEEMRLEVSSKNFRGGIGAVGKKVTMPSNGTSSEFERWRSKKNSGEDDSGRELKTPANHVKDVEIELQKAIKAASS